MSQLKNYKKPKAVILFSGGLDSTTCLASAKDQGFECFALSFDYGQKHSIELNAAKIIAADYEVTQHQIISLQAIGALGGSALTDPNIEVPSCAPAYVPARNTIFLSIALAWAEIIDAQDIFVGCSSIDYSGYPDCRPEYIDAFHHLANLATKAGIEGKSFKIHAPLMYLSKAKTIELGIKLGVDYRKTISCYRANTNGEACANCDSCHYRKKGFTEAGIADPTVYAT